MFACELVKPPLDFGDIARQMFRSAPNITEDEGTFLALLARIEPASAYLLSKVYARSPVNTFGTSKGKIYPMIARLEQSGLLRRRKVRGDPRKTELLECTDKGHEEVRKWVMDMRGAHFLLEDPLRTKVQSFDLLSTKEQLEWIVRAKEGLQNKLRELDSYADIATVPFKDQVHDNAVSSIRCRMEWLDRLLATIVRRTDEA